MPPPQKFSREQLQAAALALVDAEGLAALSMRSLAKRLGAAPMSLYTYVRDREELDALLVDAVMADAVPPEPPGGAPWQDRVRAIAEAVWLRIHAHPHAIPCILTRRIRHEGTLGFAEAMLAALARSGREGEALLVAFRVVSGFIMGLAQAQLERVDGPPAGDGDPAIGEALALPPQRFPRLREIAYAAQRSTPLSELRAGLDLIIAGLERRAR